MQGTETYHDEEVRQLAYMIWQEEGCPNGSDVQHWLKAEEIWRKTHQPKKSRAKSSKARKPIIAKTVKRAH